MCRTDSGLAPQATAVNARDDVPASGGLSRFTFRSHFEKLNKPRTRVLPLPGRPELPGSARARLHGMPMEADARLDYLEAPAVECPPVESPPTGALPLNGKQPEPSRNPAAPLAVAAVAWVALLAALSTFVAQ